MIEFAQLSGQCVFREQRSLMTSRKTRGAGGGGGGGGGWGRELFSRFCGDMRNLCSQSKQFDNGLAGLTNSSTRSGHRSVWCVRSLS